MQQGVDNFFSDWGLDDRFPLPRARAEAALATVQDEFGSHWLEEERRSSLGKGLVLLRQVRIAEAIDVARRVGAHQLLRKLRRLKPRMSLPESELTEAEVIAKLLPMSSSLDYEPRRHQGEKRPDIIQYRSGLPTPVEYEVTCLTESAEDREQTKALTQVADKLYAQLAALTSISPNRSSPPSPQSDLRCTSTRSRPSPTTARPYSKKSASLFSTRQARSSCPPTAPY
jgi:hypothetical protein